MTYDSIFSARFISRPNRFIANIEINGSTQVCHVKNTGRCRELLLPGTQIYVQASNNPSRRTRYDLIAVRKGDRLINIDSQAPNRAFAEWAENGNFNASLTLLRPEVRHGASRFDFYAETASSKMFIEIKGVTQEHKGAVFFPDAPTERGLRHVTELMDCVAAGYEACLVFIIQMRDVKYFAPNCAIYPEFASKLREAVLAGVKLYAYDCRVEPDHMSVCSPVDIILSPDPHVLPPVI